jgi:hypothetical protein
MEHSILLVVLKNVGNERVFNHLFFCWSLHLGALCYIPIPSEQITWYVSDCILNIEQRWVISYEVVIIHIAPSHIHKVPDNALWNIRCLIVQQRSKVFQFISKSHNLRVEIWMEHAIRYLHQLINCHSWQLRYRFNSDYWCLWIVEVWFRHVPE